MGARVMSPLTREEQDFAAENHDIIFKYLRKRGLPADEWYDVVIFRFLRSVRRWFTEPQLREHNFEIIAFYAMRSAIGGEYNKQRRRAPIKAAFSLNESIPGVEGVTYLDCIADPYDQYKAIEDRETIQEYFKIVGGVNGARKMEIDFQSSQLSSQFYGECS